MMRRVLITVSAALLVLAATPAAAQAPATFLGEGSATGMELTMTPPEGGETQGLVIGFTDAAVDSGDAEPDEGGEEPGCADDAHLACADAAGEAIFGDHATASHPDDPGPNDATAFTLDEQLGPLLTASIGEAVAAAGGGPNASAEAAAAEITLTATQTLLENLPAELKDGLNTITQELADGADDDPTGLVNRVADSVNELNQSLQDTPLLKIYVGPSASESVVDGEQVTTTASSQGTVVVVAPTASSTAAAPEGFVIVEVGAAQATAQTDQVEATASFDPAIARIRVLDPTTGEYDEIPVEGDEDCGGEAPLVVCVSAGSGSTTVEGASAAARADGVSIAAFADPLPSLDLALASAEVGVGATAPAVAPDEPPSTPRTGGGFVLPGLLLLAGALGIRRLRR